LLAGRYSSQVFGVGVGVAFLVGVGVVVAFLVGVGVGVGSPVGAPPEQLSDVRDNEITIKSNSIFSS
jgi:hypothetical protein